MTASENLDHLVSFWNEKNQVNPLLKIPDSSIYDSKTAIVGLDNYYYFILNYFDFNFEYVHPTVEKVLGCRPNSFTLSYLFSKIHPNDADKIRNKESAAEEFYYHRISRDKITLYKSSYTFRLKDKNGKWIHILQQTHPLQLTEEGKIHFALVVHTNVGHLTLLPDDKISFIGLNDEPSYFSLSTDPANVLQPSKEIEISSREKDIIKLLGEGLSSKQIACVLYISQHTVDTHRRNLLKKVGVKNTLELAVECFKRGVL